jgi:hypothetical protein
LAQGTIQSDDVDSKPVKGISLGVKRRTGTADQEAHNERGKSADDFRKLSRQPKTGECTKYNGDEC